MANYHGVTLECLTQEEHVKALVQGKAYPLSSLADVADPAAIKAVSANPTSEQWYCLLGLGYSAKVL